MKFESLLNHDDSLDIDLHYCGWRDGSEPLREGPTVRKAYVVHAVTSGTCYLWCEDKASGYSSCQYRIEAGQCFLMVPGKVYYYGSEGGETASVVWFSFNGRRAEEYVSAMGLSYGEPVAELGMESMEKLRASVLRMCELAESGDVHARILSELYGAIGYFAAEKRRERSSKANDYVKKALTFIEHSYSDYITVSDIVEHLSLNRSYFTKIFRLHTGYSPQQYLTEYRIRKASELIRTTELKFNEIAKCVGIREEYYFWRLFRRTVGTSPSEYKKQSRRF